VVGCANEAARLRRPDLGLYQDIRRSRRLIERLSALLDEPDCRIVVLTGAAGLGKTAFMAHIAAAHPDWLRYFIRRDSRILLGPGDARTFLLTVGGQLAALRPDLFASDKVEIEVQQRGDMVARGGAATTAKIAEVRR
jgi:hypothetical protein